MKNKMIVLSYVFVKGSLDARFSYDLFGQIESFYLMAARVFSFRFGLSEDSISFHFYRRGSLNVVYAMFPIIAKTISSVDLFMIKPHFHFIIADDGNMDIIFLANLKLAEYIKSLIGTKTDFFDMVNPNDFDFLLRDILIDLGVVKKSDNTVLPVNYSWDIIRS